MTTSNHTTPDLENNIQEADINVGTVQEIQRQRQINRAAIGELVDDLNRINRNRAMASACIAILIMFMVLYSMTQT